LIRAQQSVAQGQASGGGARVRLERPAETLNGALRILLIQAAGAGAVGAGVVVRGQLRGARVIIEGRIKLELGPLELAQSVKNLDRLLLVRCRVGRQRGSILSLSLALVVLGEVRLGHQLVRAE